MGMKEDLKIAMEAQRCLNHKLPIIFLSEKDLKTFNSETEQGRTIRNVFKSFCLEEPRLISGAVSQALNIPEKELLELYMKPSLGIPWPSRSFKNVYRGNRRKQALKARRMSQKRSRITMHAAGIKTTFKAIDKTKLICFDEIGGK